MLRSRATNISSLLAAAMSVYVCLLVADVHALAQRSSTIVAAQSQLRKSANLTLSAPAATTQIERPLEQAADQSVKPSSQDEKAVAGRAIPHETFCALLSKYLSLS
ncbi:MAG TPA: hypothetical protein VEQ40_10390 [Pyrinomonadaceae bacterium]|nr:hypothetical protein [Pyrinomonadaceae bacterium]